MFIVLEGIDGTGKSTLAKGLVRELGPFAVMSAPFRGPYGRHARDVLFDVKDVGVSDDVRALAGVLSNVLDQDYIEQDLEYADYVIRDRYVWSTMVYQDATTVADVHASVSILEPDLILVLDAPVEVAQERAGYDPFEAAPDDVWQKRRDHYLYLARIADGLDVHTAVLDATQTEEDVLDDALVAIKVWEEKN